MTAILLMFVVVSGCASTQIAPKQTLTMRWQRLVDKAGQTCERCGYTQSEVRSAAEVLRRCLKPLNINVVLKEVSMAPEIAAQDPLQSNRIFINDRSLEEWLNAKTGKNLCGYCCKDLGENVQCRTVTVDGQTHEAIPAVLIVRAGLLAAETSLAQAGATRSYCPKKQTQHEYSRWAKPLCTFPKQPSGSQ